MKDIYEMACDLVNPDGGELNETQENKVQALVSFAVSVLENYTGETIRNVQLRRRKQVLYFCKPCNSYHVATCPNQDQ